MPTPKPSAKTSAKPKAHVQLHKDGSIWARGQTLNGVPTGYWEWFRIDGTKLRSGYFIEGKQSGEWTTYDKTGKVYKVTQLDAAKPKTRRRPPTPKS